MSSSSKSQTKLSKPVRMRDTLHAVLKGTSQLELPRGTTGAEWSLMLYRFDSLVLFGTIDPSGLRKWTDRWETDARDNYEKIAFVNKERKLERKLLTDAFIRCLMNSDESMFRYDDQIGVRARNCCLQYDVRDTDGNLTELPLDIIVKSCSDDPKVSKLIEEWLEIYPAPEKGLVASLRVFLSSLLELLPTLSDLAQEEPEAHVITPAVTETPSDKKITDAVSAVGETETTIEREANLPEVSATSQMVADETVPEATDIQDTSQAEIAVAVENPDTMEARTSARPKNVSPVYDLLKSWDRLLVEQGEARSGKRDFVQQIKSWLDKDMKANSAPLLVYLGNEDPVGASGREILALTLIEMLPLSLLSAFLPRVSVSLLLSCVRRSPVASVMQSLSDSLSLRLTERLLRTYYGQTPFAEAQEILDAMRELMTLAQEEDRAALRWRFFHALTETCARAREFAHLGDSQGSIGFLEWLQGSLLPSLPLEERLRIGTALVQNVLTFDLPTQGFEPMYPILRDLLSQMEVDNALHEMLTLPPAHKAAFWQYLIN